MPKHIQAIVEDLFFAVKIQDAAKRAGVTLAFTTTVDAALAEAPHAALILLDLNIKTLAPLELLPRLPGEKVLAYVSHVQVELRAAAEAAGAARVLARSTFSDKLVAILQAV